MALEKLTTLKAAFLRYQEALLLRQDDLHRDGAIQRFEYTFELLWKTLKQELESRGVSANSPREVLRLAAREALIDDLAIWFDFLEKRNLASHVYREDSAKAVEAIFAAFEAAVAGVIARLEAVT